MPDNQNKSVLNNIADFSMLMDRLTIKNENKQNEKLNKNIENLNKNILTLAKKILPSTGLGETISDISSRRRTYDSFSTILKNRVFGNRETGNTFRNKFFTLRGALNTFGIVKRGSNSVFDQLMERRDARNQFIADQLKVNPQMTDTAANRRTFGKKFDTQQVIQKELNGIQREIDRLKDSGFTDKQIARSGLIKQRDAAAARLAASDNRLYSKIKDEIIHEVKEGILDGIETAAREAQKRLDEMDKADKTLRKDSNPFKNIQSDTEAAREEELIQKGILKGQNDLLSTVKDIKEVIENDSNNSEQIPEKKESSIFGWLKTLLGSISTFLITKMTGIVGMLKSGITAVISPLLKILGIGKTASIAESLAGNAAKTAGAAAAGGAAAKSTGILGKIKGMVKSVSPKIPNALKIAGGLLLSKPALIAGAVAGAGYLGYSMLPDSTKKSIDDTVTKFFGDEEDNQVAKNINQQDIEKPTSKIGEVLEKKIEEVKQTKNNVTGSQPTIISNPVTNNTQNSVTNNHFKSSPRNSESTYNKYLMNRYCLT